ncbi:hypothetical protein BaRGS_00033104 [Batillaria attramentaria]|uniref:nicotinamidase n=1 Tax=Batillaria attramentaria TaxID=370345 RepID=A0ABD0JLU6_9CAEN
MLLWLPWLSLAAVAAAVSVVRAGGAQSDKVALIIIDVQDSFLPGGSLAVDEGEEVIPVINKIRQDFKDDLALVILSQDWHCPDHVSFASQHAGATPLTVVNLTYNAEGRLCRTASLPRHYPHAVDCDEGNADVTHVVTQTLWPDHCIQDVTSGPTSAAFSPALTIEDSDIVVKKGYRCDIDSYSAFFDNGGFTQTELHSVLQQHNVGTVVVTGIALDFCVFYTAKDAHKLGYNVITVTDACRGSGPASVADALRDMEKTGIVLAESRDLRAALDEVRKRTAQRHTDL